MRRGRPHLGASRVERRNHLPSPPPRRRPTFDKPDHRDGSAGLFSGPHDGRAVPVFRARSPVRTDARRRNAHDRRPAVRGSVWSDRLAGGSSPDRPAPPAVFDPAGNIAPIAVARRATRTGGQPVKRAGLGDPTRRPRRSRPESRSSEDRSAGEASLRGLPARVSVFEFSEMGCSKCPCGGLGMQLRSPDGSAGFQVGRGPRHVTRKACLTTPPRRARRGEPRPTGVNSTG
jgi:hypothetical protein